MRCIGRSVLRTVSVAFATAILASGQSTKADFIFGEPVKVPNVNSDSSDGLQQVSRDGLELYFSSEREQIEGECYSNLWVSRRPTTTDSWPAPVKLDAPVNSPGPASAPSVSSDGLELYFADGPASRYVWTDCTPNPDGYGQSDLWVSKRSSKDAAWGAPENLGPLINDTSDQDNPCISADGLELYFSHNVPGHYANSEILVTTRATKDDPWGPPVNLGPNVNSIQYEYTPFISPDGLALFFARGYSLSHIYVCRRATTSDPWGPAEFFEPVNSSDEVFYGLPGECEFMLSYSPEDSTLYFCRGSGALRHDFNIWQVAVTPIVDFNADGDGFPDAGEQPVLCMPYTVPVRRVPLMPMCVPTAVPES